MILRDSVSAIVPPITTKMILHSNVSLIVQQLHLFTLFLRMKENVQHHVLKEPMLTNKKENVWHNALSLHRHMPKRLIMHAWKFVLLPTAHLLMKILIHV